jgi:sec-independent protein translocase protein TatB
MFDVGFTELLLVGLVALLVLGPERLPVAARTAGLWIGRIKRSIGSIKAEVEREIGADEIRRQLHNERILELEREMNRNLLEDKPAEAVSPPTAVAQEQTVTAEPPAQDPPPRS